MQRKYQTGLVLSGGGARGFAHIGVLKALNEHGIYPEAISAVSAGAIVGALYADGHKPDEIYDLFDAKVRVGALSSGGINFIPKKDAESIAFRPDEILRRKMLAEQKKR